MTQPRQIRSNVRVIIFDDSGKVTKYLLLLAKKGYWQNPQGGIDKSEDDLTALKREVKEETGLDVLGIIKESRFVVEYDAERKGSPIHVKLSAYAARADSKQKVIIGNSEDFHLAYKWVTYKDAIKMLTQYPELNEVFQAVCKKARLNNSRL